MEEVDKLLIDLRNRAKEVAEYNESIQESFMLHLRSLARWGDEAMDYNVTNEARFPDKLYISHVVCHPSCGFEGYLYDGGTQRCQNCGSTLLRTEGKFYSLSSD